MFEGLITPGKFSSDLPILIILQNSGKFEKNQITDTLKKTINQSSKNPKSFGGKKTKLKSNNQSRFNSRHKNKNPDSKNEKEKRKNKPASKSRKNPENFVL